MRRSKVSPLVCSPRSQDRDLEEMMKERGLAVDHSTVFRWVQCYAPEINRRMRPYLKLTGMSYRVDETYVKVGRGWKYLYRAVDSKGQTIEFMLSAKRDISAAKRFFKKMMRADHQHYRKNRLDLPRFFSLSKVVQESFHIITSPDVSEFGSEGLVFLPDASPRFIRFESAHSGDSD